MLILIIFEVKHENILFLESPVDLYNWYENWN